MQPNLYKRPNKPRRMAIPQTKEAAPARELPTIPAVVAVSKTTECHVTPAAIAQKMVWYLGVDSGDTILEPEAGTGNLIQALLSEDIAGTSITAIEQHYSLFETLENRFNHERGLEIFQTCFLKYAETIDTPKVDRILMNPPFKKTKQHIAAAEKLLKKNGVIVALVPITFKHEQSILLEELPNDVFSNAKVFTKIIRIEASC